MANLSGFNKFKNIQKLLLLSINIHQTLLPCSTYASTVLLRHQINKPTTKEKNQKESLLTSRSYGSIVKPTTIDEFRTREEQREDDFARQQIEAEERRKTDENDNNKNSQANIDAIRTKILEAALLHVPTLGFTRKAIIQGAEEAGLPSVAHGLFPEGGFALVTYFYGKCNEELVKYMQIETENGQKEVTDPLDFLIRAVRRRLEMLAPYKVQWPQALALITLPQNASTALAQVLTLVDDICYYSGDRSVDFSWYTRRIGLATIMKMTEIYMLQDDSLNHANTWEFLKSRMEEAGQLQVMLSQTEDMTQNFQRSFNSAFITARNLLGLNYTRD